MLSVGLPVGYVAEAGREPGVICQEFVVPFTEGIESWLTESLGTAIIQ